MQRRWEHADKQCITDISRDDFFVKHNSGETRIRYSDTHITHRTSILVFIVIDFLATQRGPKIVVGKEEQIMFPHRDLNPGLLGESQLS